MAILARALIREFPQYQHYWSISSIRYGNARLSQLQYADRSLSGRRRHEDRLYLRVGLQPGCLGEPQRPPADRGRVRLIVGAVRAQKAAQLLENGFNNSGLSWLTPSFGTVEQLQADRRAAAEPARRNVRRASAQAAIGRE